MLSEKSEKLGLAGMEVLAVHCGEPESPPSFPETQRFRLLTLSRSDIARVATSFRRLAREGYLEWYYLVEIARSLGRHVRELFFCPCVCPKQADKDFLIHIWTLLFKYLAYSSYYIYHTSSGRRSL